MAVCKEMRNESNVEKVFCVMEEYEEYLKKQGVGFPFVQQSSGITFERSFNEFALNSIDTSAAIQNKLVTHFTPNVIRGENVF